MSNNNRSQSDLHAEWIDAFEKAAVPCPAEFLPKLSDLVFTGARLITEAAWLAQREAYQRAAVIIKGVK